MSFISNVAKRFPRFAIVERRIASEELTMNQLREELWRRRAEFWIRKVQSVPSTIAAAKAEAPEVLKIIKSPSTITYKQLAAGAVCGVQIFGAFCLGEAYGRWNLVGYPVGRHPGAADAHH